MEDDSNSVEAEVEGEEDEEKGVEDRDHRG
jgi:hypothetical protein